MKYLNQLEYDHIPYRTHVKDETKTEKEKQKTVAISGCGLCCAAMVVGYLTPMTLTIEDCVKISETSGANHTGGTDMTILGPAIAEKFNLNYSATNELSEAIESLYDGAQVIARVVVPEGANTGLFTEGAHFILLNATDGKEFCILDPSYTADKYKIPERVGRINAKNAPYLYCDVNTVHSECSVSKTKYYIFKRKKITD